MRLRRVLKGIFCLPLVLTALFVLYEAVGLAVNHWAGGRQMGEALQTLEEGLPQVEILDRYAKTGNTSGTGNHVDLLSVVLFRTEAGRDEIIRACSRYGGLDEWSFWVEPVETLAAWREEHPEVFPFWEELAVPGGSEDCWLLYINTSAPFPDNIEGH